MNNARLNIPGHYYHGREVSIMDWDLDIFCRNVLYRVRVKDFGGTTFWVRENELEEING